MSYVNDAVVEKVRTDHDRFGKQRRQNRADAGLCIWCGEPADEGFKSCTTCRESKLEYNKQRTKDYVSQGLCGQCGKNPLIVGTTRCEECTEARKQYTLSHKLRRKIRVFEVYGGIVCACCGESDISFLTLDHIHGGGKKEREALDVKAGGPFYKWLEDNGFPPGYQVLCWNCNCAKRDGKVCPHQLKPFYTGPGLDEQPKFEPFVYPF